MLKLFQGLSKLLANYTSIFVIGVAVFTFFFPHTFDWVRGTTQTVILGIIMLTMGLTVYHHYSVPTILQVVTRICFRKKLFYYRF